MSAQDQAKQSEAIALAVRDYHARLLRALASEHTRIHDVTILETKAPTAECEALARDIAANLERIADAAREEAERERAEKAEAELADLRARARYNEAARLMHASINPDSPIAREVRAMVRGKKEGEP